MGDEAGLHLAIELIGYDTGADFAAYCLHQGLAISSLETHSILKETSRHILLLGYGHLEPDEIRGGVQALRRLLEEYRRRH
jgi:GntR family transcriptional regulator/MocR family aminotransferase